MPVSKGRKTPKKHRKPKRPPKTKLVATLRQVSWTDKELLDLNEAIEVNKKIAAWESGMGFI